MQLSIKKLTSCRIAFEAITFTRGWSLHPWDSQNISDALAHSFRQTGIIHPPIVLERSDGFFDILCGFRRLQFSLANTKEESVECLVFPKNTEITLLLNTLLADQSLFQPLSLAEKAQFIEICSRFLNHQEIVALYLGNLMLRKKISTIHELTNLLQQHPIIIAEIHAGLLQEKMAMEILRLPESVDRIALVHLFRDLTMGDGKQRKFFTLIRDLAFRQNIPISEYLKHQEIQDIVNHPVLNIPQKLQHLDSYLQNQLCPQLMQAEESFARQVRSLRLAPQCTLSHSPSFEKDDVVLSITFENFAACAKAVPGIDSLTQSTRQAK